MNIFFDYGYHDKREDSTGGAGDEDDMYVMII